MKLLHIEGPAPYITNTFLIVSEGAAAVIDPAANENTYNELLQRENAQLKYVLLTHGHHDHIAAAKKLSEAHNAPLVMHRADSELFNIASCEFYSDGEELTVGSCKIKPVFTPGHTPGSVCLVAGDVMFSGDTLFEGDVGRTDLEGGSLSDLRESLKRLQREIPNEIQVLPGHGPFSNMAIEKTQNLYLQGAL